MSLWNPRKPLNQPPHFGRVGAQHERTQPDQAQKDAARAVATSNFDRAHITRKQGMRAVVGGRNG